MKYPVPSVLTNHNRKVLIPVWKEDKNCYCAMITEGFEGNGGIAIKPFGIRDIQHQSVKSHPEKTVKDAAIRMLKAARHLGIEPQADAILQHLATHGTLPEEDQLKDILFHTTQAVSKSKARKENTMKTAAQNTEDFVSAKQIAQEMKITDKELRMRLRAGTVPKPGTRWVWPKGHKDIAKVKALPAAGKATKTVPAQSKKPAVKKPAQAKPQAAKSTVKKTPVKKPTDKKTVAKKTTTRRKPAAKKPAATPAK